MADISILYWRDMPSQIVAGRGRKAAKLMLHDRFQEAIDRAAMRSKSHNSDAYLEGWRRGDPVECTDDLATEAAELKHRIEAEYDEKMLDTLAKSGGWASGGEPEDV